MGTAAPSDILPRQSIRGGGFERGRSPPSLGTPLGAVPHSLDRILDRSVARVRQVTAADVQRLAQRHRTPFRAVIVEPPTKR